MELFRLVGSILVDNDKANKSIHATDKKAESLGAKFVDGAKKVGKFAVTVGAMATASGAAIMGLANKTADHADQIDKMSQKIGLSRKAYQEWDYVMSQNGMNVDSLKNGMKTLTGQIGKVTDQASLSNSAFGKLGFSLNDIKNKSREDLLKESIMALQNVKNETERATLANQLFGRSGVEMAPLLSQGSEATQGLIDKANELGLVMGDKTVDAGVKFKDTMDTLKRSFNGVVESVGAELLPIVSEFAQFILDNMPSIRNAAKGAFTFLGGLFKNLSPYVIELGKLISDNWNTYIAPVLKKVIDWINKHRPEIENVFKVIISLVKTASSIIMPIIGTLLNWIGAAFNNIIWPIVNKIVTSIDNIVNKFNTAKDKIGKTIDKIKGFFNFKISWPKIPMPHFKVDPKGWGIGDLLKGKIPKIGIDFYAKAMDYPMTLDGATMFGVNAEGQPMVGGETGKEYITGDKGIQNALKDVLSNLVVVLEDGTLVGHISDKINKQLYVDSNLGARFAR